MTSSAANAMPRVTVVLPTRGRRELVRLSVAAVVAQRYDGDIRCIVVHDQEQPDEALHDFARPGRTVETIVNEGNPGLAAARNAGLALATSDVIASCDDDDTWLPDKLQLQVERLLQHPEMLVVGGGINLLMPQDRVVVWLGPSDVVTQDDLFTSRRKELHSSTLVMRRRAFELAGRMTKNCRRAMQKTTSGSCVPAVSVPSVLSVCHSPTSRRTVSPGFVNGLKSLRRLWNTCWRLTQNFKRPVGDTRGFWARSPSPRPILVSGERQ